MDEEFGLAWLAVITAWCAAEGYPLQVPRRNFPADGGEKPDIYIQAEIVNVEPTQVGTCNNGPAFYQYIGHCKVHVRDKNQGEFGAKRIVDKLAGVFNVGPNALVGSDARGFTLMAPAEKTSDIGVTGWIILPVHFRFQTIR